MQASTYSPEMRRMLLFLAPWILAHSGPASMLLRGHLALATLSPPETDLQILERWGYAHEVHLDKSFRAKDFGLECLRDVQRLWSILHIGSVSVSLSSSRDWLRWLRLLKDTTPLSCDRWSTSSRSSFQLMTGVTVDIESPRSLKTLVTVDNRLPYIFMPIILLQHGCCSLVIILLRPLTTLFINLAMCEWALFPKPLLVL